MPKGQAEEVESPGGLLSLGDHANASGHLEAHQYIGCSFYTTQAATGSERDQGDQNIPPQQISGLSHTEPRRDDHRQEVVRSYANSRAASDEQEETFEQGRRRFTPFVFNKILGQIGSENQQYVKRENAEKQLNNMIGRLSETTASLIKLAITGLTGMGKSEFAKAFAYNSLKLKKYSCVIYLSGD